MSTNKDDIYHIGLTDNEVLQSREKNGANLLTPPKRPSLWKLYLEKFEDPVVRVLLVAAAFSLIISIIENEYAETIGIIAAILLATGIGFFFEYDANKKFDLLNAVNEETLVKVIRNGRGSAVARGHSRYLWAAEHYRPEGQGIKIELDTTEENVLILRVANDNLFLIDGNTSLLENLVAISLIRQFGKEDAVFFYNKGIEVDFYIPEKEWAIQVSYSIKDLETRERETDALIKLSKVLPCKRFLVITFDEESVLQMDNHSRIEVISVWKWLLMLR